ncbi:alpha/beta hydrolase fold domain-containing protein [Chitinophaga sp. GCM10012297]|uniref:Alpha/beta hydrolase n=1 Tax=Chitinophaga chungangae TaxID=2821488 RepID=A0ABS3YCI2_9BACT|nr:alpha/beta hydrolase [Chitinophaga chungangae]MBO9152383.1 alpha/beta hydrolase [Chitinophaga chungangae]
MASFQSRIFTGLLRLVNKKGFLGRQLKRGRFNRFDCPEPPAALFHSIERDELHGRKYFSLKPPGGSSTGKHILYLHGGAYVQCFTLAHWYFLSDVIDGTGAEIIAPDYPLAPEYTYKDAFVMVETLYKQMLSMYSHSDIVVMGDSAGGGFALALAQKLKTENMPVPGQIILLSPWLDITLENPEINNLDQLDPFLGKKSLQQAGRLYAGSTPPNYYLLSPINGPLDNLGRITVFAGSHELLAADTRKLKRMASLKGVALDYHEYPEMVHAWMLLNFPESKKARQQIIDLVNQG